MTVDAADWPSSLEALLALPAAERLAPLVRMGLTVLDGARIPADQRERLVAAMVSVVSEGAGQPAERVQLGEVLGRLGDPRLATPDQDAYWLPVETDDGPILIGRFPVTNQEFRKFVEGGGYREPSHWSPGGWAWLQATPDPWPERAKAEDARPYVVDNQPVVGVSWYEAEAYAKANGARLPRFDERSQIVRGREKRPYPWGSPFGEGHANTQEEVVGRPCAVGLYVADRTPEGVQDLAGNAAEWTADGTDDVRWYHPGAWDQPSMAAWVKARESDRPETRTAGLGFRIAKD